MTDRITIPPEAVEAAAREIYRKSPPDTMTWEQAIEIARVAIAAALDAWPGAEVERFMPDFGPYTLHLPLPQQEGDP